MPASVREKVIQVDLALQIVEGFEGNVRVFRYACVCGDRAHPTERGVFKIWDRRHPWVSHTYHVPMNYALFFTQDGKALHQYHGPLPLALLRAARRWLGDRIGSHGCVRLSEPHARALWDWAPSGTTVNVV